MPELPEAHTIARSLAELLAGATVARAALLRPDFLKTGSPRGLARLAGQTVRAVTRRGKGVILHFRDHRLLIQLGMAGRVFVAGPGEPAPPHTHLAIGLVDGRVLRCANARRIAAGVHLLPAPRQGLPTADDDDGPLARLGPDADAIAADDFLARLAGRKAPVKAALLNQAILAGVGNIYADEALFRAGIRPLRPVRRIARPRLLRLHAAIRAVLAEAIAAGGSTIPGSNPYADAHGEVGRFAHSHRVYGRFGLPCTRCRTRLRRTLVAGRTTTFCPACQR